jgi:hypothetical protein
MRDRREVVVAETPMAARARAPEAAPGAGGMADRREQAEHVAVAEHPG